MNKNAFRSLSYGVYIISTLDGERTTGCVANSVMQITSSPATIAVSMNHDNYTNSCIKKSGKFAISILSEESNSELIGRFGFQSGKDVDKFAEMKLTKEKASVVSAPMIGECPVNIECKVTEVKELGSHHMFLADVVAVHVDDTYMNENQKFELGKEEPIAYSHGEYYQLGQLLGTFGYSVKKKKNMLIHLLKHLFLTDQKYS